MTTTDGINMNRWLYRAAGTVGIAGGFLLLGAAGAQADEAEDLDALLGDVLSPTNSLPALNLSATTERPATVSDLRLDPADGRVGILPIDTLPAPADLPVDMPSDPSTAPPSGDLFGRAVAITDGQLPAVIADQLAAERGGSPELLGGGLPLVGPAIDPIGQLVGLGNLPAQLPVVGGLVGPTFGSLPIVSDPAAEHPVPGLPMAGERPIAGADPEFTESAEVLPLDPVTNLAQPVIGLAQPVVGFTQQLPAPLGMLTTLPSGISAAQLLPL